MAEAACFFLGEHDYLNGFFCKSFKHSLSITYTSDPSMLILARLFSLAVFSGTANQLLSSQPFC
jgi:hypothetical protein